MLKTKTLRGVELMRAGTWPGHGCPVGGCKITAQDLGEMVACYKATAGQFDAPVKLGHTNDQKLIQNDGLPAAGWVTNLRLDGDILVGDLDKVPAKVADLIEAGAYRKRSSEIGPGPKVKGREFKYQFLGLALLGADLPAVEGLDDIIGYYHSLNLSAPDNANVLFFASSDKEKVEVSDDDVDSVIADLEAVVARADALISGRRGAPRLRSLVATAKDELRRVAGPKKLSKEGLKMDLAQLAEMLGLPSDADEETVKGKLAALIAAVEKKTEDTEDKGEMSKEAEAELKATVATLSKQVIELTSAQSIQTAEAIVDKGIAERKIAPAARDASIALAKVDPKGFTALIEKQPELIPVGEIGSSGGTSAGNFDFTKVEPSQVEVDQAKALGFYNADWRQNFMATKAKTLGLELPANFGKETTDKKSE